MVSITSDDSSAPATKADISLILNKLGNVPTRDEMNKKFAEVPTRKELKGMFDDIERQLKNLGDYITTILNNLVAHHDRIARIEKELQLV